MCDIKNITGVDVKEVSKVKKIYTGKENDTIDVNEILKEVEAIWTTSFNSIKYPIPSSNDIILVKSKKPRPTFEVEWKNSKKDIYYDIGAITIPSKKKIFLTYPLPDSLSSEKTFAHELGHWLFDRLFDSEIKDIPRDGTLYKKYSAAMAIYVEEIITENRNDCNRYPIDMEMHRDGCQLLREFQDQNIDIFQNIYSDFKTIWNKSSKKDCP
jgi:hypothetical protein